MSDIIHELDARRLLCPMPVIRVQDKLKTLEVGHKIKVTCTDPGVKFDIPAWCKVHGHEVMDIRDENNEIVIVIQKRSLT